MKSSILNFCSKVDFHHRTDSTFFLVDFSKKTNKQRGVEMLNNETELKGLRIENKLTTTVVIGVFDDHCFKSDDENKDLGHCEAVFFSESYGSDSKNWILFVELKYSKSKKFSRDFKKGKEQLLNTISIFRQNGLVEKSKLVHAVLSFPERRNYASYGFNNPPEEIVTLRRREKIHFEKTNIVHFISDTIIRI